ncbi:unnamed protein product [Ilex paraguariensis]|uniref:CCHC-type domain-containing protein n=1 Tax=Ilex paraguariensis TaxID=185542 RepID=A0ABC8TPK0_9AQUA
MELLEEENKESFKWLANVPPRDLVLCRRCGKSGHNKRTCTIMFLEVSNASTQEGNSNEQASHVAQGRGRGQAIVGEGIAGVKGKGRQHGTVGEGKGNKGGRGGKQPASERT